MYSGFAFSHFSTSTLVHCSWLVFLLSFNHKNGGFFPQLSSANTSTEATANSIAIFACGAGVALPFSRLS
jgi:hypothetical protein